MRSFVLEPVDGERCPPSAPASSSRCGSSRRVRRRRCCAASRWPRLSAPAALPHRGQARDRRRRQRLSCTTRSHVGDVIEVGAPRGDVHARRRRGRPVALLSAGVGVTPVLAMLGAWPQAGDARARCGGCTARAAAPSTPFADRGAQAALRALRRAVVRALQPALARRPCRPRLRRRSGRVSMDAVRDAGVPAEADFYLCGPSAFLPRLDRGPVELGGRARAHAQRGVRPRAARRRPGSARAAGRARHRPRGRVQRAAPDRALGRPLREPARAGRGVRRARRLVVPHRRVPPLRVRPGRRRRRLRARAARRARRRASCCCAARARAGR